MASKKPKVPLSDDFHKVEVEAVNIVLRLKPKERAILVSRLNNMFGNPQGAKSKSKRTKGSQDKERAAQPPPNPLNAAFGETIVGTFGKWISKNLRRFPEDFSSLLYKVHIGMLRVRVTQKNEPNSYTLQVMPEGLATNLNAEIAELVVRNWLSIYPTFREMEIPQYKELLPNVDNNTILHLIQIIESAVLNGNSSAGPSGDQQGDPEDLGALIPVFDPGATSDMDQDHPLGDGEDLNEAPPEDGEVDESGRAKRARNSPVS